MDNRLGRLAVISLSAIGLAACTNAAEGNPIPDRATTAGELPSEPGTTGEKPSSTGELPSDGAPKVENPIDAGQFEEQPCDALTTAQATELNVGPEGELADTEFGKGCLWRNAETGGATSIAFMSNIRRGLSIVYGEEKAGYYKYFEPTELEGFPAVISNKGEGRPTANCSLTVGLSDELAFLTVTNLSRDNIGAKDPCEVGMLATGEMLKTIKANS